MKPCNHGMEHQAHVHPDARLRAAQPGTEPKAGFKNSKIASAPARCAANLPITGYIPLVATRLSTSVRQAASSSQPATEGGGRFCSRVYSSMTTANWLISDATSSR
jgi:hypothetical protein